MYVEEINFNFGQGSNIPVLGRNRVQSIASEFQCPKWLLEFFLLETSDCRRFVTNNERKLLAIDFDLLTESTIKKACSRSLLTCIPSGFFVEDVHREDLGRKLAAMMAGAPTTSPRANIVEGIASSNAIFFGGNDISIVDPLFSLNNWVIIYDNGELYQWKFADFIQQSSVRPKHSSFASTVVNVMPYEVSVAHYHSILGEEQSEWNQLQQGLDAVINERRSLIRKLEEFHRESKAILSDLGDSWRKSPTSPPPRLGRFDSVHVTDSGEYMVKTDLAPTYFQSAVNHVWTASKIDLTGSVPDDVLYNSVPAIIMAYLCLDSHVNSLGYEIRVRNWATTVQDTGLLSKIKNLTSQRSGPGFFRVNRDLKGKLAKLVDVRNNLVHFSNEYYSVIPVQGIPMSEIYKLTDLNATKDTLKLVIRTIRLLHDHLSLPVPNWLGRATGWLQEVQLDFL